MKGPELHSQAGRYARAMRGLLFLLLFFSWLLLSLTLVLQAEQGGAKGVAGRLVQTNPDPKICSQILDAAFRTNLQEGTETSFSLRLRFLPSFHPESQIVIRYEQNGHVSVDYMVATVQLSTVIQSHFINIPVPDIAEAAKLMDIKQKSLALSEGTAQKLFHDLWAALAASTALMERKAYAREIQLDGTQYILQYQEGGNSFTCAYMGSEVGHEDPNDMYDLPIIKWMIAVRQEVAKLVLENGKTIGNDGHGTAYHGSYRIEGD